MIILTIRTDKPEAELGIYKDHQKLDYIVWTAHRQLAETINLKIEELLKKNNLNTDDLGGIVIYKGPGSFTGLRIGFNVANAFSYGLSLPIISETTDNWLDNSISRLLNKQNDYIAKPDYGSEPHITTPKK